MHAGRPHLGNPVAAREEPVAVVAWQGQAHGPAYPGGWAPAAPDGGLDVKGRGFVFVREVGALVCRGLGEGRDAKEVRARKR